ncbi:uncharacterized protein N7473_001748 [Penicillium subrubescens]|uniref:NAD(P)-binding domain-containing protein n=1 Tax=Penicillium subrubescens TaxID=1316194 RepID=A0A1Q5T390_9EURO|nr:uncharacterized protein N7473_001748 [Penicillium subrubescens]KAJ5904832.1 hypothetical protein N7473_001748 [Penicillium subrubescens]OKO94692.1 hypothetical protein PENSUB_11530 [Penicillium subrubescens]
MSIDAENDVLLLTCASGKQCSHVIPLLYGKLKRLRLVVHRHASVTLLKTRDPDAEVVQANMAQIEDISRIIAGVTAAVFIAPAFHPKETGIGYA